MSRVIVIEFTSLDGVMHDPDGSDGSAQGGWAFRYGPEAVAGDKFGLGEVLITLYISFALIAKHGVTGHDLSYTFTLAGIPGGLHGLAFGMIFSALASLASRACMNSISSRL